MQQVFGAARQGVDDGRHHLVRYVGAFQQRRAGAVEQTAVVSGHADFVVSFVNQLEDASQVEPKTADGAGETGACIDLVAHFLPQTPHAVRRIARVAHRQQIAVFGVKHEQQAVQQHQRGFAHFIEILRRELRALELAEAHLMGFGVQVAACQCVRQMRKNVGEDARAQVLRHFFFVQPGFIECVGVKGAFRAVPTLGQEGVALEEQVKQAQGVVGGDFVLLVLSARQAERRSQIDFKKLFGARARVLPVQAPYRAVGQHAPFDGAV